MAGPVFLVGKSPWYIKSHFSDGLSRNEVAEWAGVTPYFLARAFAETTGHPVLRYVWCRRLTHAAEALAYGRAFILTVALDVGYACPETFTRACRAEFGQTSRALHQYHPDSPHPTEVHDGKQTDRPPD